MRIVQDSDICEASKNMKNVSLLKTVSHFKRNSDPIKNEKKSWEIHNLSTFQSYLYTTNSFVHQSTSFLKGKYRLDSCNDDLILLKKVDFYLLSNVLCLYIVL